MQRTRKDDTCKRDYQTTNIDCRLIDIKVTARLVIQLTGSVTITNFYANGPQPDHPTTIRHYRKVQRHRHKTASVSTESTGDTTGWTTTGNYIYR
eukprot:601179-Amphidinium_carterae.1